MGFLFPDVPQDFEVIQGAVRVSARGVTDQGLLVEVFAEGEPGEEETLKESVADFFRDARLKVPLAPVTVEPAPLPKGEAPAPATEPEAKPAAPGEIQPTEATTTPDIAAKAAQAEAAVPAGQDAEAKAESGKME